MNFPDKKIAIVFFRLQKILVFRLQAVCLLLVLLLSACGGPGRTDFGANPVSGACLAGKPMIETQLYFGLSGKKNGVSPAAWRRFVAREIAPRFPEGFTIVDGRGFWLGARAGRAISENSRVVLRLHPAGAADSRAIDAIIENYKRAFAQDSVLRVDIPACAAF